MNTKSTERSLNLIVRIFAGMALLLSAACFSFDSLGDYWEQGAMDPALTGAWRDVSEKKVRVIFSPSSREHRIQLLDEKNEEDSVLKDMAGRTLTYRGHLFLMAVKKPDLKSAKPPGMLYPYRIEGKGLVFYTLTKEGGDYLEKALGEKAVKLDRGLFFSAEVALLDSRCLDALIRMLPDEKLFSPVPMVQEAP